MKCHLRFCRHCYTFGFVFQYFRAGMRFVVFRCRHFFYSFAMQVSAKCVFLSMLFLPCHKYLYINLRRSLDCCWMFVNLLLCGFVALWLCGCASFIYFGQLLYGVHIHALSIMKVYIKRNNIQMELIRFRKNWRLY